MAVSPTEPPVGVLGRGYLCHVGGQKHRVARGVGGDACACHTGPYMDEADT